MEITDVRVSPPIGPFEWTLVRVDTDEGPSGYGELPIFSRVHPDDLGQVRAALVGQRPYDIEPLLAPLQGAFEPARHLGLVHGTEIALLDLVGQLLGWLEDPIPPGNHEAMAKVTAKARVPICTGEMLRGREQFRDLLVRQAADVIQPDTPRASGMRDLKKIADLADLLTDGRRMGRPAGRTARAPLVWPG